mmetsp:Transcript_37154/g.51280  ORF Transcript_37154/g.51280 Transcript_37154/m.51280 type:complete len:248 (-) Transcript_37154:65-808(-)
MRYSIFLTLICLFSPSLFLSHSRSPPSWLSSWFPSSLLSLSTSSLFSLSLSFFFTMGDFGRQKARVLSQPQPSFFSSFLHFFSPCSLFFWFSFCFFVFVGIVKRVIGFLFAPKRSLKNKKKIAVIGGGIAGCSTAWSLSRSGFDVVLYESRNSLGGNAKTHNWSATEKQEEEEEKKEEKKKERGEKKEREKKGERKEREEKMSKNLSRKMSKKENREAKKEKKGGEGKEEKKGGKSSKTKEEKKKKK